MQEAAAAEILPEIDDFEIINKIGEGGNAEIFKARQKSLDRFVAIKVLSPDSSNSPDMVRRCG
ncbi:MAG: hypothetical protein NTV06_04215 [candidate division Zixibacteria bacterium]|nr:hypothetical protein [candidate division Zixibacteria bacterium]